MKKTLLILFMAGAFIGLKAQDENTNEQRTTPEIEYDWFNQSPIDDQVFGAEADKAYQLVNGKEAMPVIVAVIDGGVDIHHEDLYENIWINKDEIPDNGVDDDQNGYIDDLHGWNFLGNAEGENIAYENLEITRIYKKYHERFKDIRRSELIEEEKELYDLYQEAEKRYQKSLKRAQRQKEGFLKYKNKYLDSYRTIAEVIRTDSIKVEALDSLKKANRKYKKEIKTVYNFVKFGINEEVFDEIESHLDVALDYHLNPDYNPREIIGDDPTDLNESYGNNNVYGPEAFHGTFVSGIIGAKRDNELGIDGIARDVRIMALKVVPDGDERDKDVAKAIRYAVDNGARIINMSFGKELSPYKSLVDDAVLYAQEKGVLFVHAAGNDAKNIDKVKQYPTKIIDENTVVNTWITVGANSRFLDKNFAATFTNYGDEMVDLFAPGVRVRSLAPENNYQIADGTSFSAPVVSGIAALLLSYYPELSANELKEIILDSVIPYPDLKVYKPKEGIRLIKGKTRFRKLSQTGGIVSAYQALLLAEEKCKE
ncbi:MAG: S8 family peptidase [Bacteroidales bacterium]|jgi:subtilisin family serine protease|nr:S8 family peptidase [Bacteroidales bacterium]